MKYYLHLVCISLLISFISCKEEKKEADNSRMKEVMAIHDEAMPKMGRLSKLVAEMKVRADTSANGEDYAEAMEELQEAHDAMMDWMRDFGDRFDPDEILNGKTLTAEKQAWLLEEEDKIEEVREQINSSIERAEKLLEDDKRP